MPKHYEQAKTENKILVRVYFKRKEESSTIETTFFTKSFEDSEKTFYAIFGKKKYQFLRASKLPIATNQKTI